MTNDFKAVRLCQEMADHCSCLLSEGHDSPHMCACGGIWKGSWGGDDFVPIRFPQRNVFTDEPLSLF